MHTLIQDLRYGFRMLLKQKGLTAIALLSLALGIGANTALFSVVDAILLKMLPVNEPERLVLFRSVAPKEFSAGGYNGSSKTDPATGLRSMTSFPYQSYQRMREQQGPLTDLFAFASVTLNVNADGRAELASGQVVSGGYFAGLGVQPFRGRMLTDEDDKPGVTPVAVLSHRYWQERFGSDSSVVGKQINVNNVAFTVIGVTPPGFNGTMNVGSSPDVTVALQMEPTLYVDRKQSYLSGAGIWWVRLMGRLKPGATMEHAQAQLEMRFCNRSSSIERRDRHRRRPPVETGSPISIRNITRGSLPIPAVRARCFYGATMRRRCISCSA